MSSKGDGGPAFPNQFQGGMTLRDWFAGQALCGELSVTPSADTIAGPSAKDYGKWCYELLGVDEKNRIEAAEHADEVNRAGEQNG